MSTVIEPTTAGEAHHSAGVNPDVDKGDHAHKPNGYYVKVALILAAMTAAETSTYYINIGKAFMPVLLTLMVIKFVMVVSLFMHLKFDNKLFSVMFYTGLILAVLVYLGVMLTFRVFDTP
jgi:cytochrome c oxidase subunit 4